MEDEELKKLLLSNETTLAEVREYLKKIHRQMVLEHVFSVIKIILIIAPIIYGFYVLGPVLKNLLDTYKGLGGTLKSIESLDSSSPPGANPRVTPDALRDIINRLNIGR